MKRIINSKEQEIARVIIVSKSDFKLGILLTPPYIENYIEEAYAASVDDLTIVNDLCSKVGLKDYEVI